jgi:hypothetical protein
LDEALEERDVCFSVGFDSFEKGLGIHVGISCEVFLENGKIIERTRKQKPT